MWAVWHDKNRSHQDLSNVTLQISWPKGNGMFCDIVLVVSCIVNSLAQLLTNIQSPLPLFLCSVMSNSRETL